MHPTRLQANFGLLIVAAVWGAGFSFQRMAFEAGLTALYFNALRFGLGALALAIFLGRKKLGGIGVQDLRGGALLGSLLLISSMLQQIGVQYTTAGKAGFLTGLYLVFVPFFLRLFWSKMIALQSWVAVLLASIGLGFLSLDSDLSISYGDSIVLLSAVGWAFHLIYIERLVVTMDSIVLAFLQFAICSMLSLGGAVSVETFVVNDLSKACIAVGYAGGVSIALGYTFQVVLQRFTSAVEASLIMSLEAVFSVVAAWILLGEILSNQQIIGCLAMCVAMILAQIPAARQQPL